MNRITNNLFSCFIHSKLEYSNIFLKSLSITIAIVLSTKITWELGIVGLTSETKNNKNAITFDKINMTKT